MLSGLGDIMIMNMVGGNNENKGIVVFNQSVVGDDIRLSFQGVSSLIETRYNYTGKAGYNSSTLSCSWFTLQRLVTNQQCFASYGPDGYTFDNHLYISTSSSQPSLITYHVPSAGTSTSAGQNRTSIVDIFTVSNITGTTINFRPLAKIHAKFKLYFYSSNMDLWFKSTTDRSTFINNHQGYVGHFETDIDIDGSLSNSSISIINDIDIGLYRTNTYTLAGIFEEFSIL